MRRTTHPLRLTRGVGLIDALIALAILSFGLLALTQFQVRMVAQATESQSRSLATQLGDELISTALVDVGHARCYTLPQRGTCNSQPARDRTAAWAARAAAALPGTVTAGAVLAAAGDRYTVTLTWTGKQTGDTRSLEATTDVRP